MKIIEAEKTVRLRLRVGLHMDPFIQICGVCRRITEKSRFNDGSSLARHEGFEPPTYWFVASHSIQLS